MSGERPKTQYRLPFPEEERGEAPILVGRGTEPLRAASANGALAEGPTMEEVTNPENLRKALKRVRENRGSPGVDGMSVGDLAGYLANHWSEVRSALLEGSYRPQPVLRKEIPKPDGKGTRALGIPTALDRFIQQSILQVLQPRWDPTFSEHSYGFRPGRSAHQAVSAAQRHIAEGHEFVVDIDLEKFFDRVNHDMLMARVAKRVGDKRLLKIVRGFLNAGVMDDGLVGPTEEGTPQGGPLSPLLSNLMLDDLDRELERRGHRFVRYADDCNIYVRSERAGRRVMENVGRYITRKLKLRINAEKSAVARPQDRKFLGFSFTPGQAPKRRIAPQAVDRLRKRVRVMTRRNRGVSVDRVIAELGRYLVGWRNYFGFCETPSALQALDSWIRRRLRCLLWRRWRRCRTRYAGLRTRGVGRDLAAKMASSSLGPWRLSRTFALSVAFPNSHLDALGLPRLAPGRA
jgi:RNA-directed DNA polymerase